MIWGGETETSVDSSTNATQKFIQKFYVGRENQYQRNESHSAMPVGSD